MARWWKKPVENRYRIRSEGKYSSDPYQYCVCVCGFTFAFSSLEEIPRYIEHYEKTILPSSRLPNFVKGPRYGDHEECQRWYERLPLRLREGTRRPRVIKALKSALADFQKASRMKTTK